MDYQLLVYAPKPEPPSVETMTRLLELAGWQWAPIAGLESFSRTSELAGSVAVGWDLADDVGDSVIDAVAAADPELLSAPVDQLSAVDIALEDPSRPDPELISELRKTGADPDLVTRVEQAGVCWSFRTGGRVMEPTVEFIWALASAVGVLTDGVLLDDEDGTLLDCTDDGD
jgi:hypothetical protein